MEGQRDAGVTEATRTLVSEEEQSHQEQGSSSSSMLKVMAAMDDNESSFYALDWVLTHICPSSSTTAANDQVVQNCLVYLVHVNHPFQSYVYPAGPVILARTQVLTSVRKAQAEVSSKILARALQKCRKNMIKAETVVLEGEPKEMICQAVEKFDVDLLVVGSRGLGVFKRAFLGSVSDYCSHYANCAVLIVKPPPSHPVQVKK